MHLYTEAVKYLMICSMLAVLAAGCASVDVPDIQPPMKKQVEDRVICGNEEQATAKSIGDVLPGVRPLPVVVKPVESKKTVSKKVEPPPVVPFKRYLNVNRILEGGNSGSLFLTNENFIVRWNIFGPFYYSSSDLQLNGTKSVLHREFVKNEKSLSGTEDADTGLKWRLVRFDSNGSPGQVDLAKVYRGKNQYAAAYAVTYLYCNEPMDDLILYAGSSGYIKIWINHQLVHAYDRQPRAGKWDQDVVKNISLRKGYNLLVVKCVSVGSKWDFFLRFSDRNDKPLKFVPQN